ncbi:MAG: hypothetical protein AOA65_0720 [Candidatus Bathyarchaeota archaeon BA1]|nr:MAG: hypothetical protein AOA65_0720 [Candidatus Bathyarchaeota archaeon BA1]
MRRVLQLCLNIWYNKFILVRKLTIVSVRVSDEMKKKMDELHHLNWSEFIRQSIMLKIREEEMRRACETMDSLAAKTSGKWSGTEEIRKWRDSRYGRAEA